MTVLIYTSHDDRAAEYVSDYLAEHGVDVRRLDSEQVPHKIILGNDANPSCGHRFSMNIEGKEIHSDGITAIWYRKHLESTFARNLDMTSRRFFNAEASHVLEAIWLMADCYWMNHPSHMRMSGNKLEQLNRARSFGIHIPDTLVTNSYDEFITFYEKHHCRVLVKILSKLFVESNNDIEEHPFSSVDSPSAVKSPITMCIGPRELDIIRSTPLVYPHQFQEYVDKTHDIKLIVVGKRVFGLESQAITADQQLTVGEGLLSDPQWSGFVLPERMAEKVLELVSSYHLTYSVLDFVRREDGEYVFIKMNSSDTFFDEALEHSGMFKHLAECLRERQSLT